MGGQRPINAKRARRLRASGLTWRQVGVQLAIEEGRRMPYQPNPVMHACGPGWLNKLRAWREARNGEGRS